MKRLILILSVIASLVLPVSAKVSASSLTIHGLSVTPDIYQAALSPGQDSISYQINLGNDLTTPIRVSVTSLDFKSLNESGGLLFIGSAAPGADHKYGLANWIELPTDPITLQAGKSQQIPVKIANRDDLAAGGHYAAIIFHVNSAGSNGTNPVQLNQEVSSLVFVRKLGGDTYSLHVTKAQTDGNIFKWPGHLKLTIANTGNTQTAPAGYIDLLDQRTLLNENSNLVLPGSSRLFNTHLSATPGFWPQKYTISVHYRPDALSNFSSYAYQFWYINPLFVLIFGGLLVFVSIRYEKGRRAWAWVGLKIDQFLRRLEVWVSRFMHIIKRSLVWLGLKIDRQLRRLELAVTRRKNSSNTPKK